MNKLNFKNELTKVKLRNVMLIAFTITSSIALIVVLISYSNRVSGQFLQEVKGEQDIITRQINGEVSTYVKSLMNISDTLCYSVLLDSSFDKENITEKFQLIYDSNKNLIKNISLFDEEGSLLVGSPAVTLSENVIVSSEKWFEESLIKRDNIHISNPHIQKLFVDSEYNYEWVISVSRNVTLEIENKEVNCVLLVDVYYSSLDQIFKNASLRDNSYVFLMDSKNNIIQHPKMQLINSGYIDGDYNKLLLDKSNIVTSNTVGYTGWNVVGVSTNKLSINSVKNNLFFISMLMFYVLIIFVINYFISKKVSSPIVELEDMVKDIEEGNLDVKSYIDGFYEVEHLGNAIENMAYRIKKLMKEIEEEHELKMISEFETLQSQINPHFLYNTLEVIVWMIENEQPKEASKAVISLSKFFRISLSKGKSIISVSDEIEHVKNYLLIQSLRYKDRFVFNINMDKETKNLTTIKLILQPIVENAIYHGLEYVDEGEINISSYIEENFLYFLVEDNGLGMTEEVLCNLKNGNVDSKKLGSGIGIKNIDERIKIYFGKEYGINIVSELDVGTRVYVKLPIVNMEETYER
ncbi:MAG: sensor histidine kinase [Lachnospirales bacterium]